MDLTPAKGMRDFLPPEAARREHVVDTLKKAFKRYGFLPLETPVVERYEVLSSKFAGGEEILKETFRLQDQGKRELGLRYDLTVPMCRVLAGNTSLPKPFKRYQVAPVYRDGPLKTGRYREFVQCDVDTVGVSGVQAEAEQLALTAHVFFELGLKVTIKFNNRKLLNGVLEDAGISQEKHHGTLLALDKLSKIGENGVLEELEKDRGLEKKAAKHLLDVFMKAGSGEKALNALKKTAKSESGKQGLSELEQLVESLKAYGVKNAVFSPELSRGLNYYTGTVFEVFAKESEISSSLAAGGRYDDMIGNFSGKEKTPAVGISFGLDVIGEVLKEKSGSMPSPVQVFVVTVGDVQNDAIHVAESLRKSEVNVLLDLAGRGVSKNLSWASAQQIPFVVIVGEKEVRSGKFTLRDMASGKEKSLSLQGLALALGAKTD
ncbi:histidine--tRNA ligase [Candidatus Micrarchaeota archaeon]|nr:histidine--tRNA ligase [Candidatus Micrarchaeota archaeon]